MTTNETIERPFLDAGDARRRRWADISLVGAMFVVTVAALLARHVQYL